MAFAGRVLRFPDDRSLGHLYNLLPDGSWEDLGRAQGELWVPTAARLHLTVTEPRETAALADIDPHAFFSIDVHRVAVASAQIAPLGRLVGLRRLFLSRIPRLGDAALVPLTGLWALKSMALDHTAVSDDGLASLARLHALQELDLAHTRVEGRRLDRLAGLRALRRLDLSHTAVDDAGISGLAALPQLEELGLRGTRVTPRGAAALLEGSHRLRVMGDLEENAHRLGLRKTFAQA
jgi:Leucine Rich Repeat (LRR) protein